VGGAGICVGTAPVVDVGLGRPKGARVAVATLNTTGVGWLELKRKYPAAPAITSKRHTTKHPNTPVIIHGARLGFGDTGTVVIVSPPL
jgi:hypothetical protein